MNPWSATLTTKFQRALALVAAFLSLSGYASIASAGAVPPGSNHWPTFVEQLQQHKIDPNSALASFVKQNQDFSLLDNREMNDQLPYPAWLRISYRKEHPEFKYSASDPTHGYPHVLHEVLEWMLSHQSLQSGPPSAPGASTDLDADWDRPAGMVPFAATVGTNVRASGAQTTPRSESDIRINPWNSQRVIAGSNAITAAGTQAMYYSSNGGSTWGQSTLPLVTPTDSFHSDPTVDWTSDGTAWSSTLGINNSGNRLRLRLYNSTDNGATWNYVAQLNPGMTNADKQMHWTDHSGISPYANNQYFIWHEGNTAYMNVYTAGGTVGTPVQVDGAETTGTPIGMDVKTNECGHVFGAWPDTGSRGIYVVKSVNGGGSYSAPVKLATTYDSYDIGIPAMASRRALIYVSIGAYKTATKNNVYAAWTDLTGAAGCNAAANEPNTTATSTCKTRVWFSRSTDGGATWSAPVMTNNAATKDDQFNQDLEVDPTTGEVAIIYYWTGADTGSAPSPRLKTNVYYQASFDDGATFGAPVQVTTAMTDETVAGADSGNQYGDYNGLSAYAGSIFPSWTDRRNAGKEEIWTAPITDSASVLGPPTGVNAASTPPSITVTWNAVVGAATYRIYRLTGACPTTSTCAGFTLIGSSATTSFNDTSVAVGTTYAYIVTAVSSASFESVQSSCSSATAQSCTVPGTPTGVTLSTPANNTIRISWSAGSPAGATYNIYRATGSCAQTTTQVASGVSGSPYDDTTVAGGATYSYQVTAVDASGSCESGKSTCAFIGATGGPNLYSNGRFAAGRPVNTSGATGVKWIYTAAAATLSPPGGSVYVGSNDRFFHGMTSGAALAGGRWPATWKPFVMNSPAQSRPRVAPATIGPAANVAILASQDGKMYCVNADTGGLVWSSNTLGSMLQGGVSGTLTQYGNSYDVMMIGTRNASSSNSLVAVNPVPPGPYPAIAPTAWTFSAGGTIGIINGAAAIDGSSNRAYFTSRALDSTNNGTVWCVAFTANSASVCAGYPRSLDDIDGSPVLYNGVLYVGTNTGLVYALNAATGATLWSNALGDGPVKGSVWPVYGSSPAVFYVSTTNKVFKLTYSGGASAAVTWSVPVAGPSIPYYSSGTGTLYVGSSDGKIHQFGNLGAASPTETTLTLGTGTATIGSPATDSSGQLNVGADDGRVYSIVIPF